MDETKNVDIGGLSREALNAAVAEEVFGDPLLLTDFCGELRGAWQVVERMQALGWGFELGSCGEPGFYALFLKGEQTGANESSVTLPEAICRAAVQAVRGGGPSRRRLVLTGGDMQPMPYANASPPRMVLFSEQVAGVSEPDYPTWRSTTCHWIAKGDPETVESRSTP